MARSWICKSAALLPAAAASLLLAGIPARGESLSYAQVERGRYLATAGDCVACHTRKGGTPYAGGRGIETPFGIIYSPNLTPDKETGIGLWTDEEFYRAMHEGIAAGGKHLYPAFPYPWFTKLTRDDVDAVHAFLESLPPVRSPKPENKLPWPLGYREVMRGWNALYFKPGTFVSNPSKSAEWNRGAYLVEGAGHCGACHTPKNMAGAADKDVRFQGSQVQDWYAPALAGDLRTGLGPWSQDEIVAFLKTGRNARTVAYGPMAEVVADSTSKLDDADLAAIAAYLKDQPPTTPAKEPEKPDPKVLTAGEAIYVDNCGACHRNSGEGAAGIFPSLKGNANLQAPDPSNAIRLVLEGGRAPATGQRPTQFSMPAFGWKLTDQEIASVLSYARNAWGNAATTVSAGAVHELREKASVAKR
jgi:mono/diheme cytochrome c family protein